MYQDCPRKGLLDFGGARRFLDVAASTCREGRAGKSAQENRNGARGGNRTHTALRPPDFESGASASSATRAR